MDQQYSLAGGRLPLSLHFVFFFFDFPSWVHLCFGSTTPITERPWSDSKTLKDTNAGIFPFMLESFTYSGFSSCVWKMGKIPRIRFWIWLLLHLQTPLSLTKHFWLASDSQEGGCSYCPAISRLFLSAICVLPPSKQPTRWKTEARERFGLCSRAGLLGSFVILTF